MLTRVVVAPSQRAALLINARYQRLLQPGVHWIFNLFERVEAQHLDPTVIVERVEPGDPVPVEVEGATAVLVKTNQLAVVEVDGRVRALLQPGRFRLWTEIAETEVTLIDVLAKPEPIPASDRLGALRSRPFTEAVASARSAVVLLQDGAPVEVLEPGRYRAWHDGPWSFVSVSLELEQVELAVQDVMTSDEVPVRLRPIVAFRVRDPLAYTAETLGRNAVYSAVQLALREVVGARSLEAVLSDREALSTELLARAREQLPDLGIELQSASVKDVILSAEVKAILSQVAVARKESEAQAIRRREEVASTRQQLNTAKVLASNPVLLRLKELEVMAELAGQIDKLVVVGGSPLSEGLLRVVESDV